MMAYLGERAIFEFDVFTYQYLVHVVNTSNSDDGM